MTAPSIDPNLPEGDPPRQTPNPAGAGTPPQGPVGAATGEPLDDLSADDAPAGDVPEPGSDPDFKISREQFNDRLTRAMNSARAEERKRLKEIFGTDDPAEIKKIQEEHSKLKAETEKQRRERMNREQQLEEDLKRERQSKADLEQRIQKMERQSAYQQQDSAIKQIASKHIASDYLDDVSFIYARNVLAKMTQEEADAVDEKAISKWFADYAKKRPAFARDQAAGKPPPKRAPITTGKPPVGKPKPNGGQASFQGKTPRPGQPNSMSKEELAKFKKEKGLQW